MGRKKQVMWELTGDEQHSEIAAHESRPSISVFALLGGKRRQLLLLYCSQTKTGAEQLPGGGSLAAWCGAEHYCQV